MSHDVVGNGQGRDYDWSSDHIFVKVHSDATDGRVAVVEDTLKPGFHLPRHYHKEMTEIFYILKGDAVFRFDEETVVATPGMTVSVPPHAGHDVTCENGGKLLTIFTPGGFDHYLAEMASLTEEQFADDELMEALAEKYDSWTCGSVMPVAQGDSADAAPDKRNDVTRTTSSDSGRAFRQMSGRSAAVIHDARRSSRRCDLSI